jgi:chromosome segregation ATPase
MTNEEFQEVMIEKFAENDKFQKVVINELKGIKGEIKGIKGEIEGIKGEIEEIKGEIGEIKTSVLNIEIRQDDIYQVVRAIEHSNIVGKSELDSHNIRIAKVEGKLKKAAKVFNQDTEVDKASNL